MRTSTFSPQHPRITPCSLLIHAALFLLFLNGALGSTFTLVECNRNNAEKGTVLCKDAFQESFRNHKSKLILSPKRTGCCLSHYLGECLKFSFTEAKCDPKEQKVAIMIKDQIHEAQASINKVADYLGTLLCGDAIDQSHCGKSLLHELHAAEEEIKILNGVAGLASGMAVALTLSLAMLHSLLW